MPPVRVTQEGARATVTLARPEVHNALDPLLLGALMEAFRTTAEHPDVRVVVLAADGPSFCAGADLRWMRAALGASLEENRRDAAQLADLLEAIVTSPKPVIARVHGAVLGGGMGLVAACDLAVATPDATFGLPEVRLGLVPAMIFPFLLRKVAPAELLWAALTGSRFPAERAHRMGLVNAVAADPDAVVDEWCEALCAAGPQALAAVKELFRAVPHLGPKEARHFTVDLIARIRTGEEAQEGMRAFLEKRQPSWRAR